NEEGAGYRACKIFRTQVFMIRRPNSVRAAKAYQAGVNRLAVLANTLARVRLSYSRPSEKVRQQSVDRYLAGTKDQDDERCDQERVGRCGIKLVGIRKDRQQRFAVCGYIRHDHVDR